MEEETNFFVEVKPRQFLWRLAAGLGSQPE